MSSIPSFKSSRTEYGPCEQFPKCNAVLYRILGNDIPGRHVEDQTLRNLRFILDKEETLPGCEKRFVLNRIINATKERLLIGLLKEKQMPFIRLPFQPEIYRTLGLETECLQTPDILFSEEWDKLSHKVRLKLLVAMYRLKNLYALNNNGGRNVALEEGRRTAAWTLPWDGNCFVSGNDWKVIQSAMCSHKVNYIVTPLRRIRQIDQLKTNSSQPAKDEPQIAFHRCSDLDFDENFPYGFRPKVELLMRLGVEDIIAQYNGGRETYLRCPRHVLQPKRNLPQRFRFAGEVKRLPSGHEKLEQGQSSRSQRYISRMEGILKFLVRLDMFVHSHKSVVLISYNQDRMNLVKQLWRDNSDSFLQTNVKQLLAHARVALSQESYSIAQKAFLPPSLDRRDYFSCPLGMRIDLHGHNSTCTEKLQLKATGKIHHSEHAIVDDRQRLLQFFEEMRMYVFAFFLTGEKVYGKQAARLLHTFFIQKETMMNPNLNYASFGAQPSSEGLLEMREIPLVLDAVRLLESFGILTLDKCSAIKEWMGAYQLWLLQSNYGKRARLRLDHLGLFYDLQVCSIAAYLGVEYALAECLARAQSKISHTSYFSKQESLQHDVTDENGDNSDTLLGYVLMARLAERFGVGLWTIKDKNGAALDKAIQNAYSGGWWKREVPTSDSCRTSWLLQFMLPTHYLDGVFTQPCPGWKLWRNGFETA